MMIKPKSISDKTTKSISCRMYEFTGCLYAPTASKKGPNSTEHFEFAILVYCWHMMNFPYCHVYTCNPDLWPVY